MLPFLKPKLQTGLIVSTRKPDSDEPSEMDEAKDPIEECTEDLIKAVHSRDVKQAAKALKDVFEKLDKMPHEEGPHIEQDGDEI